MERRELIAGSAALSGGQGHEGYEALAAEALRLGLFDRTYGRYALCAAVALAGMGASLYAVTLTSNPFFQFCNAILLGFFSVQIGMVGHDLSHGEVFVSRRINRFCSSLAWGLCAGLSEFRWFEKHNQHHLRPNHVGHDPDLSIPFMFGPEQVKAAPVYLRRWVLPHQHFWFWPALSAVYPFNIMYSMRYYLRARSPLALAELALVVFHFIILGYFVFTFLPLATALLFFTTVFAAAGVYMGLVFAPNHKGRPELAPSQEFSWIHQILFTRDLRPSWGTFYLFGGLNFQIEHHLFPTMSRFKYRQAYDIVRDYCTKAGIEHHETTWGKSLGEMHRALRTQAHATPRPDTAR